MLFFHQNDFHITDSKTASMRHRLKLNYENLLSSTLPNSGNKKILYLTCCSLHYKTSNAEYLSVPCSDPTHK